MERRRKGIRNNPAAELWRILYSRGWQDGRIEQKAGAQAECLEVPNDLPGLAAAIGSRPIAVIASFYTDIRVRSISSLNALSWSLKPIL